MIRHGGRLGVIRFLLKSSQVSVKHLWLSSAPQLCGPALRLSSAAQLCTSALQLSSAAQLCSSALWLSSAAQLCGSALRLSSAAQLCGSALRLSSAAQLCGPALRLSCVPVVVCRFLTDHITGDITVAACSSPGSGNCLDREQQDTYHLSMWAGDKDGEGNLVSVPLTITVIDENDNPPRLALTDYLSYIDEGLTSPSPDIQVQVGNHVERRRKTLGYRPFHKSTLKPLRKCFSENCSSSDRVIPCIMISHLNCM